MIVLILIHLYQFVVCLITQNRVYTPQFDIQKCFVPLKTWTLEPRHAFTSKNMFNLLNVSVTLPWRLTKNLNWYSSSVLLSSVCSDRKIKNLIFLLDQSVPVSYTHLDVYKRQVVSYVSWSLLNFHW